MTRVDLADITTETGRTGTTVVLEHDGSLIVYDNAGVEIWHGKLNACLDFLGGLPDFET